MVARPVTQSQFRKWTLSAHVYACRCDDQVVLLDLMRDKYLAVGAAQSNSLKRVVENWPGPDTGTDDSRVQHATLPDPDPIASRLVQRGLLTDPASPHGRLPMVTLPEATATLGEVEATEADRITSRCLFQFLRSASSAAFSLRARPLLTVVRAVIARRAAFARHAEQLLPMDRVRRTVAVYERLRPLLFTSNDKCLFDSLALVNFLAYQRIFPRWVIGVTTGPFGAHSWVQSDQIVLNDLHEHVRRFTPILVV